MVTISLEWATLGTQHATAAVNRPRAIDCELSDTHRLSTTSLLHAVTASVRVYVDQLDGNDSAASPAAAAIAAAVASAPAESTAITTAASRLLELYAFRCLGVQKTLSRHGRRDRGAAHDGTTRGAALEPSETVYV